ncbi:hypothetical protein BIW11_10365 [Tropilaelaps mercedesae]|uniref:Uncharacterized protein n=1 Tax=Tropilaelaps mercedesae TaxID=418985 RepID=A0A1V9XG04_9ACAR|nr:hypothetical protein BIW11_10365 [Tropilaelaps mercedesae]
METRIGEMQFSISDSSCDELDLDVEVLPFEVNLLEARRVSNRSFGTDQPDACVLTVCDATNHSAVENSRSRATKRGKTPSSAFQLGSDAIEQLEFVIDRLGEESAKAQGLRAPITSLSRFIEASSIGPAFRQRIYVFTMAPHDNSSCVARPLQIRGSNNSRIHLHYQDILANLPLCGTRGPGKLCRPQAVVFGVARLLGVVGFELTRRFRITTTPCVSITKRYPTSFRSGAGCFQSESPRPTSPAILLQQLAGCAT